MKKEMSEHAKAAKAIRNELKAAFPGTQFSVRSDSFAGGTAVDVSWTDGPCGQSVDAIINKYQYGHFDGMQDLYEYSNHRDDLPQVKYVMSQRSISADTEATIKNKIATDYAIDMNDNKAVWDKLNCWPQDAVYRAFRTLDLQ